MKTEDVFSGLNPDMYNFFWEIAFQNNRSFFECNRARYAENVRKPLLKLAACLGEDALKIDPSFNVYPNAVLSRINRDTRYSKDKSPYRDHLWIGYKPGDVSTAESFCVYFEFTKDSFGYGMGMYAPVPSLMNKIRENIASDPEEFIRLSESKSFKELFSVEAESYKKERYSEYPECIRKWLNYRRLAFCYSSTDLRRTLKPEFLEELKDALNILKPVYRFLMRAD